MRRSIAVLALMFTLIISAYAYGVGSYQPRSGGDTSVSMNNEINSNQSQDVSVIGGGDSTSISEGGDASSTSQGGDASSKSDSTSSSGASINTRSVSNYETRTPPLSVFPPYLPYWNHGGWGTIKGYFPNGPNGDDTVYERAFNPSDSRDMKELKGVLKSLSYDGPLESLGGILNGVGVVFGGPDNFHHGRGFEIANSLVRERRPRGKPLLVFIDSSVDRNHLRNAGYAYVGQVSLEGNMDRNWDHVYDAAIAETLPWDVDILLVSGGMKGVTVGSNVSFPGAAGAYSQTNYSISLFGSVSSGITEGKGEAVLSAEGYRFWPDVAYRRRIPQFIRDSICVRPTSMSGRSGRITEPPMPREERPAVKSGRSYQGVEVSPELLDMAGF